MVSFLFAALLYVWDVILIQYLPAPDVYIWIFIYSTIMFLDLAILDKKPKLLAYFSLLTYFNPLIYVVLTDPRLTYSALMLMAIFSVPGLVPGLLLMSRKDIIKRVGVSLTFFNVVFNLILEIFTGVSIADFTFLNSMFITDALFAYSVTRTTSSLSSSANKMPQGGVATVVIKGLPQGCPPIAYLNGTPLFAKATPQGDYVLELSHNATITLSDTICYGVTYTPDKRKVKAMVGYVVLAIFSPNTVT